MNFRQVMDFESIAENLTTFTITMFFVVLFGGFFIDPTGPLPSGYHEVIQEPSGFILPFYMAYFGFLFSMVCVQCGLGPFPQGPIVRWLIRAPTRAGVAGLSISTGALFGTSLALLVWSGPYGILWHIAWQGIVLATVLLLILIAVVIAYTFNFLSNGISLSVLKRAVLAYGLGAIVLLCVVLVTGYWNLLEEALLPVGISAGFVVWLLLIPSAGDKQRRL